MKNLSFIFAFLLLGFTSLQLVAQVDSLTNLSGTSILQRDVIQIEGGVGIQRNNLLLSSKGESSKLQNYLLLAYGLNSYTDLQINYNFPNDFNFKSDQIRRGNGVSTLVIGFKHKLSKSVAFKSDIGFLDDSMGQLRPNMQFAAIHEFTLDKLLTWENRIGFNWFFQSSRQEDTANANYTRLLYISRLKARLPSGLHLVLEAYGNGQKSWRHFGNLAVGYHLNQSFYLQLNNGFGNLEKGNSYTCSLQIAYRLIPTRYLED